MCTSQVLGQVASLKGAWVSSTYDSTSDALPVVWLLTSYMVLRGASQGPHEHAQYRGLYDPAASCPAWAKDWDCQLDAEINHQEIAAAYNKVFRPHECALRPWSAQEFARCTADRRIIMIGDSLMRQQWLSLACLLSEVTVSSLAHPARCACCTCACQRAAA